MVPILKSYLKRLTNLSSRNKSILLLRDSVDQFIDLHAFDFVNNKKSYELINQLIADKKTIQLCDEIDPRFEKVNELSKRLKRIARTEKFIEQERGSEDLYIGYPFVKGKLLDGTVLRCPLLFFPVTLQLEKQKWNLIRRENEPITFNRSFLLAYAYFNHAKIEDDFLEKTFEDFSKDSLEFRTQLFDFLKESPIVLNFNQELFSDSLLFFEKLLKSDLDLSEKNGELKLQQQAVLGIFPQAGSFLVPDYEFLIEKSAENSEEYHGNNPIEIIHDNLNEIFESKAKQIDIEAIKEEKIMAPFAMDASQELAIRKVNAGQSMVIQGPPGTGKSQLICNLIADFAAAGKKVLVVCQKRAALDVVHQRLGSIGFENFAALVHDFKNDRKALFSQIAEQISLVDDYKKKNLSLDALWLEQDFNQTSRQIDRIAKELDGFKAALFDVEECGLSVKSLYLSSNPNVPSIDLSTHYQLFKQNIRLEFTNQLKAYDQYAEKINKLDPFWKKRVDYQHFNQTDLSQVKKMLADFPQQINKLKDFFLEKFDIKLSWAKYKQLISEVELLKRILDTVDNQIVWENTAYFSQIKNKEKILADLEKVESELKEIFGKNGIDYFLNEAEFESIANYVSEAVAAKANFLSSVIYDIFSKQKSLVKSLLSKYNLSFDFDGITILNEKIIARKKLDNWLNVNQIIFEESDRNNLLKSELSFFINHFQVLYQTRSVLELISNCKAIKFEILLNEPVSKVKSDLKNALKLLTEFADSETIIEKYLTSFQIEKLVDNPEFSKNISIDLENNFDIFVEADRQKSAFSHTEWAVIAKLYDFSTTNSIDLFENSLNLAWIQHIEEKYPILRSVSSLKMEQMEAELQEKIIHKQSLSQQILLIKAREHTYNGLEYNRLRNLTTYRELLHQVTKKKKLWSIRQLFGAMADEIFDLVPCWLASPETVSAVFPMQPFFDLVIFDEASQCYAESGLPAIYRGKQVVITGDSKQLQPSDLYAVRFEDETEETPELEVNSLLDLAIQYLPQTQLNGHYRSQSIDLIGFSNEHFYKNQLQILPHYQHINLAEANIKFIKVEGIFQENKNDKEAEEVVALVQKLRKEQPEKSIGIVTFNYRQQNLIQDLLEQSTEIYTETAEHLFVKNIENVQGDERDIIIFSVAYGPDVKGKIRIQFGTLNQAGGENRLNVAITRARYQIYMVTSIYAQQLNVEDTLNEGPKLLKKYMEYAQLVSEGKYITQSTDNEATSYGKQLKNILQNNNNSLKNELPFADLVEKNGSNYESLLLTDDNLYFQSLSAKEAHAYWAINFQQKGWKHSRTFSREYWKKQEAKI